MAKRGQIDKKPTKEETVRPIRIRRYDKFILIVCEDEACEPYYFKKIKELFPKEKVFLREIGTGKKPKGIVETAIIERDKLAEEINKTVDEVWVVFDKDDEGDNATTLKSFNEAWDIAAKEQMKIAFSNEVFELWLLIHFISVSHETPIPRETVYEMLKNEVKKFKGYEDFVYKHGKTDIIDVVFKIGNEQKAIARAELLLKKHNDKKPIDANPSTYIHLLVKHLRELINWYSYVPN